MKQIKYTDENLIKFIGKAILDLKKASIKVVLENKQHLYDPSGNYSGYFDEYNREFRCAFGKKLPVCVDTFVHEYSHFLQYKDKAFIDTGKYLEKINDWMCGGEYDKEEILEASKYAGIMENDCDKRAVNVIKEYGLNVDLEKYILEANAYTYFYFVLPELRVFLKSQFVYSHPTVKEKMPKEFLDDYSEVPKWYSDFLKRTHKYKGS